MRAFLSMLVISLGLVITIAMGATASCSPGTVSEKSWNLDVGGVEASLKVPESWILSYREGSYLRLDIPLATDGVVTCLRFELARKSRPQKGGNAFYRSNPSLADIQDRFLKNWRPHKVLENSVWFGDRSTDVFLYETYESLFGRVSVGRKRDVIFFKPIEEHRHVAAHCTAGHRGRKTKNSKCYLTVELDDIIAVGPERGTGFRDISTWRNDLVSLLESLVTVDKNKVVAETESISGDHIVTRSLDGMLVSVPQQYYSAMILATGNRWTDRSMSLAFEYSTNDRSIVPTESVGWGPASTPDRIVIGVTFGKASTSNSVGDTVQSDNFACKRKSQTGAPFWNTHSCRGAINLANNTRASLRTYFKGKRDIDSAELISDVREFLNSTLVVEQVEQNATRDL